MSQKTNLDDIMETFLTACAESEGITDPQEMVEYIKNRKKFIETFIVKKDAI